MIKVKIETNKLDNKYYLEKIEKSKQKYSWNAKQLQQVKQMMAKYPKGKEQSAALDILFFAQHEFDGWICANLIKLIANTLNCAEARIQELVSFHSMLNSQPVGKYSICVCTNCSCMLNGSNDLLIALQKAVGEMPNNISKDGLFSLNQVECLGACVKGPVITINGKYYEKITPEKATQLIKDIRNNEKGEQ